MKTDVEELSPTRVKLTVEVPFEDLKPNLDAAYRKVAQQVRVPGFRPGKVPPPVIDQRFGRGVVLQEAVNEAVPQLYGKAVEDNEVFALGQPELEVTKIDDGEELEFTAEVDIRPKFEVPDYDGMPVTVDDAEVTPDEVEEQLGTLRERFAVLKGVDRPVEDSDYVSIDLAASVNGEPLEDASTSGLSYQVGEGSLLEGLDEALRGMTAGESKTFHTALVGGEHAGEQADVTVTVHSVKNKELPELDDEFAQTASEFDTIGELRADTRSRLEQSKRTQQFTQARDRVLEALMERVEVPLPDSVVASEVERRNESFDQQLQGAGLSREQYLEAQGQSTEDFDAEVDQAARQAVRAGFVLDQLALQEELDVEENDVGQRIIEQASQMGVAPNQLAQYLVENNQMGVVVTEVLRGKALDLLVEHAKVTEESGNSVDIEQLFKEQRGESGDENTEEDEGATTDADDEEASETGN